MNNTIRIKGKDYHEVKNARMGDFFAAVKQLQRPYIRISQEEYDAIMAFGTSDVIADETGRQYTFGNAESTSHYWLMPLLEECYYPDEMVA